MGENGKKSPPTCVMDGKFVDMFISWGIAGSNVSDVCKAATKYKLHAQKSYAQMALSLPLLIFPRWRWDRR